MPINGFIPAFLADEHDELGCHNDGCDSRDGTITMTHGVSARWKCAKCGVECIRLPYDVYHSSIGVDGHYPQREAHPKRPKPQET
jgi:hypothetical protein